jgi:molybdopterin-containing oxidoreductase family iron-sulfur binding subunit
MGRPIKVEGNPRHPASLGATDVFAQAQVLDFYDPDRAWAITAHGSPSDQSNLRTALAAQRAKIAASRGNGFRILTGAVTSPTLAGQLDTLLALYPEARWHRWQAISRGNVVKGAVLAYGEPVELAPKLAAADVIFAIDSDLLSSAPGTCASRATTPLPQSHADAGDEPSLRRGADADADRIRRGSPLHRRAA